MRDPKAFQLPFLVRDMLAFEGAASFDLEVSTASVVVQTLELTGMTREGPFLFSFKTTADSLTQINTFAIPDVPIWVSLRTASSSVDVNNTYAVVYFRINKTKNLLLCQGMVAYLFGLNWPFQSPLAPLQSRGKITSFTGTNPAANNDFLEQVPQGQYWRVLSVRAILVTAAAVANRRAFLEFILPSGVVIKFNSAATQIISQTSYYNWFVGAAVIDDQIGLSQNMPLVDDLLLPPGSTIGSGVVNMNAGDNWSSPYITMEIFFAETV